jgi:hypothetical protein
VLSYKLLTSIKRSQFENGQFPGDLPDFFLCLKSSESFLPKLFGAILPGLGSIDSSLLRMNLT